MIWYLFQLTDEEIAANNYNSIIVFLGIFLLIVILAYILLTSRQE